MAHLQWVKLKEEQAQYSMIIGSLGLLHSEWVKLIKYDYWAS